jgi:hypothetical protein
MGIICFLIGQEKALFGHDAQQMAVHSLGLTAFTIGTTIITIRIAIPTAIMIRIFMSFHLLIFGKYVEIRNSN